MASLVLHPRAMCAVLVPVHLVDVQCAVKMQGMSGFHFRRGRGGSIARFLGLGHLRRPGVSLGRILGVLSIEPFFWGGVPAGGLYRPPPPPGNENPASRIHYCRDAEASIEPPKTGGGGSRKGLN